MTSESTLDADRKVARLAATQWGVLSRDELLACGLTRTEIARRAAHGWLHPLYRKVYAVGHPDPPRLGRWLGAVKACGLSAMLSYFSAAALWELLEWDHRSIEVTVLGKSTRIHRGLRVHRTHRLAPEERSVHKGIPVTSVIRTLIDLASIADADQVRRAVRQGSSRQLFDPRDLLVAIRAESGRRGIRTLKQIVATSTAPTASVLEDVVLDLVLAGGFEHPDVNAPLDLDGRRVVPDLRWPGSRIVVEADGAAWHDDWAARRDDAERQALLEAHGERVIRVTWEQAVRRPSETLARLRAAGVPLRSSSVDLDVA